MRPILLRVLAMAAFASLLAACNVADQARPNLLSLKLDDSLSNYDSIRVDILYPSGKPYLESVFHGAYVPDANHALDDLDLGENAPANFQVLITAFRDSAQALVFAVKVGPEGAEAPKLLIRVPPKDTTTKPPETETRPVRVVLNTPSPLSVFADGQALQVLAEVEPKAANQGLVWTSSDTAVARVDAAGMVYPGQTGSSEISARSLRDPSLSVTLIVRVIEAVRAKGINIAPDKALLYVGGESLRLEAQATPAEAHIGLHFSSADTTVANVTSAGVVTALAPGHVDIKVYPEGAPSLALACHITVMRDVPTLETGGDRNARPGDTLSFPIKVSQEYGTVAALKWDLDGDGAWDDSTNQVVASPRKAYDGKDSLVTVFFYVRDGEGNEALRFLFVHVGAHASLPAPAFATGTTASPTRNPRPSWAWTAAPGGTGRFRYSLDGGAEIETRELAFTADSLADGMHTLGLRELDAFGSSSATVAHAITVVTQGPKVSILTPGEGLLTNAAAVAVTWTVKPAGGAAVTEGNSENLAGRQGAIAIVREALDSLGNRGSDTVTVYRDTIAPEVPAFTAAGSPAVVNGEYAGQVQWAWTRTGASNDQFLVSLNGAPAVVHNDQKFVLGATQNQTYFIEVREVDSAGNASASLSGSILVDRTAPPPPVVSENPIAGASAWTWTAAAVSDGARVFRYRLATGSEWSAETLETGYAPTDLGPGTHTLIVEERDNAGNWSAEGSATLINP